MAAKPLAPDTGPARARRAAGLILLFFLLSPLLFSGPGRAESLRRFSVQHIEGVDVLCDTYTIQPGDFALSVLSLRGQIAYSDFPEFLRLLRKLNPQVEDINRLYPGQKLSIPIKVMEPGTYSGQESGSVSLPRVTIRLEGPAPGMDSGPASATPTSEIYKVAAGDSVSGLLSARFGPKGSPAYEEALKEFKTLNPMVSNPNRIYAGTTLVLPVLQSGSSPESNRWPEREQASGETGKPGPGGEPPPEGTPVSPAALAGATETGETTEGGVRISAYTVQPGDTVSRLLVKHFGPLGSTEYKRGLSEFTRANPAIRDLNHILAGERINIPEATPAEEEASDPEQAPEDLAAKEEPERPEELPAAAPEQSQAPAALSAKPQAPETPFEAVPDKKAETEAPPPVTVLFRKASSRAQKSVPRTELPPPEKTKAPEPAAPPEPATPAPEPEVAPVKQEPAPAPPQAPKPAAAEPAKPAPMPELITAKPEPAPLVQPRTLQPAVAEQAKPAPKPEADVKQQTPAAPLPRKEPEPAPKPVAVLAAPPPPPARETLPEPEKKPVPKAAEPERKAAPAPPEAKAPAPAPEKKEGGVPAAPSAAQAPPAAARQPVQEKPFPQPANPQPEPEKKEEPSAASRVIAKVLAPIVGPAEPAPIERPPEPPQPERIAPAPVSPAPEQPSKKDQAGLLPALAKPSPAPAPVEKPVKTVQAPSPALPASPLALPDAPPVLPDRSADALNRAVELFGSRLLAKGDYFLPRPGRQDLHITLSRTPLVELPEGRRIILVSEGRGIPEDDLADMRQYWKSVIPVPVKENAAPRELLGAVLAAAGIPVRSPEAAIQDGSVTVRVAADLVFASPEGGLTAVTFLSKPEERTLAPALTVLKRLGVRIVDLYPGKEQTETPPAHATAATIQSGSCRKLVAEVCALMGVAYAPDVPVSFPYAGFSLTMLSNMARTKEGKEFLVDFGTLYGQAQNALTGLGLPLIQVGRQADSLSAVENLLSAMGFSCAKPSPVPAAERSGPRCTFAISGLVVKDRAGARTLFLQGPLPEDLADFLASRGFRLVVLPKATCTG
ncbi:MAG: LysM peptidoglycan-binding domain-containing protein [Thermodesulfobacteriota bacterium]